MLSMGLKYVHEAVLLHSHVQDKTIDSRIPGNEIRTQSSIKCKQTAQ